jgi:hypothetical protein
MITARSFEVLSGKIYAVGVCTGRHCVQKGISSWLPDDLTMEMLHGNVLRKIYVPVV